MKNVILSFLFIFLLGNLKAQWNIVGSGPDYYLNSSGKAGLGNSAPASWLDIGLSTTAPTINGPTSSQVLGAQVRTTFNSTAGFRTGGLFYTQLTNQNTDGISSLSSVSYTANNGLGGVAFSNAVQAMIEHRGSGPLTWARGILSEGFVTSSGNVSNWAAFYSSGVHRGTSSGTGTINNGYGLFLEPLPSFVTHKFAISALDPNALSEFGGTLQVATGGKFQIVDNAGANKVLVSDGSGFGTWQTISSGGNWSLLGNAGTIDGTNFLGTTDAIPLNFRVNNTPAGRIDNFNRNTYFGEEAGLNSSPGSAFNVAMGFEALFTNSSGYENVAVGSQSLYSNQSGLDNVAIGPSTLYNNTTGSDNTACGRWASLGNSTGGSNSAFGATALASNTIGSYNCAFGSSALGNSVSGSYNSAFGYVANTVGTTYSNATAIGAYALVSASNKIRLGDATVTAIEGQVAYSWPSDGRFKRNISETDVKGLDFINKLRPVVYNFDTRKFQEFLTQKMPEEKKEVYFKDRDFTVSTAIRHSGFIAQEVEIAAKNAGYDFSGLHKPASDEDNYSISYEEFVVPLVKAVQELSQQNEQLKKEIEEIKSMLAKETTSTIKISQISNEGQLSQNSPNPFKNSTFINYSVPSNIQNAVLKISSISGTKIKEVTLKPGKNQNIEFTSDQLSAGTYIYTLFVDNVIVDSKQMTLSK